MSSLNRFGIRGIIVQSILLVIGLAVLFISAGTLDWTNAWVYVGLVSSYWVISTVVLAIVNPGYAGLIVSILAYPLILGSWWGFVLSGILTVMIVIRTGLEDRMLQRELPGYTEYAKRVKYRLIPLVW